MDRRWSVRMRVLQAVLMVVCIQSTAWSADALSLAGEWSFRLDPQDQGVHEAWFSDQLDQPILLPGSLQAQGYGHDVDENTKWIGALKDTRWLKNSGKQADGSFRVPGWLQPEKHYLGAAWYQRQIDISDELGGRDFLLSFERVHITTTVWLNGQRLGSENSLSTPHEYLLKNLRAGTYTLTVKVDNRAPVNVGKNAHCYSDHTQTTWNGIIGKIELKPLTRTWIDSVSVFPDVAQKQIRVRTYLRGDLMGAGKKITLRIQAPEGVDEPAEKTVECDGRSVIETTVALGETIALWDEFTPNLYHLTVSVQEAAHTLATTRTQFGMVEYKAEKQDFLVNGRKTCFRGTLDCASFPLTGYPAMDIDYWKRVFTVCKNHGLNHVRYHSWFPPEVALFAADEVGVYLQCEHAWTKPIEDEALLKYLDREAARAIKRYGNHPSFSIHSYGNEPGGGAPAKENLSKWVEQAKRLDEGRRLYVSAAGWGISENSDFYDIMRGMRVYPWKAGLSSSINQDEPSSDTDFSAQTQTDRWRPFVAHETGQWCVYPNFDEMKKYTGFLKPRNYEIFQQNLTENEMGHLWKDFFMASGRLQTLCYKYEIEKLLRTPGCGGYQLLGLNDFPGQGTALVGPVDVFWDTKPYTSPEEYRRFGGATVPLARFPKFTFTEDETPSVKIEIAHFGAEPIPHAEVEWQIKSMDRTVLCSGTLSADIPLGLSTLSEGLRLDLGRLTAPAQYKFEVSVKGTRAKNGWDFWVYPPKVDPQEGDVRITRDPQEALDLLGNGKTVLLVPQGEAIKTTAKRPTVSGFSTIFWNTVWSGRQPPTTMGILCDPKHPVFKDFPTEYHSNYQWWHLVNSAVLPRPLLLDGQEAPLRPVVRMIDDWFTTRRLGLVVEAKVGAGKLLISAIDISATLPDNVVLNQFRASVLNYMNSSKFNPCATLDAGKFSQMIEMPTP